MSEEALQKLVFDPEWQNIQEMLRESINARILWISANSGNMTEIFDENYHEICNLIRNNPDGLRKCNSFHHARFMDSRRSRRPALSECYCGLMGFTVPIVSEDQIVGVIGGYIPNSDFPITLEKCAEIATASKTDIKEVMSLAKEIKHISKAEQRQILNQLSWFAGILPSVMTLINKASLTSKIENQFGAYLTCLNEVYDMLKSKGNIDDFLDAISKKIKKAMSVDASSIYILDQELDELSLIATAGFPDSTVGQRIKVGEGIVGHVAQTQTLLAIEDATLDPRAVRVVTGTSTKRRTYRSVLSAPLIAEDKVVGVIDARTYQSKSWGQNEIDFLGLISKIVADAIAL